MNIHNKTSDFSQFFSSQWSLNWFCLHFFPVTFGLCLFGQIMTSTWCLYLQTHVDLFPYVRTTSTGPGAWGPCRLWGSLPPLLFQCRVCGKTDWLFELRRKQRKRQVSLQILHSLQGACKLLSQINGTKNMQPDMLDCETIALEVSGESVLKTFRPQSYSCL